MLDLSLYNISLKKVAIILRTGVYKSYHHNPFSDMPSNIVNDLMYASMNLQRSDGFRADALEQLLISGRIREFKIEREDVAPGFRNYGKDLSQTIIRLLNSLKSGCHELEVLYLEDLVSYQVEDEDRSTSDISEVLASLFENSPNLKDLHCCFIFDLRALRNCNKLRSVKLHFWPQQSWYNFLAIENDEFLPQKYLKIFTVCHSPGKRPIPYADIVVILGHCPELTSLGFIESSELLALLHKMNISPSELKLRHCYWKDWKLFVKDANHSKILKLWEVRDAVLHYPLFEELDFDACSLWAIRRLKHLRNLVYLNIASYCENDNVSTVFSEVLQEIGPQLKHLSLRIDRPVDISILLQYCPNLESLRIVGGKYSLSASSVVSLPHLQRLAFRDSKFKDLRRIIPNLSGCNQLTELFLENASGFDDESLRHFLKRNSLSNLKVVFWDDCCLSELGFREFVRNVPRLEEATIIGEDYEESIFNRVLSETNPKAKFDEDFLSKSKEFFVKRCAFCVFEVL